MGRSLFHISDMAPSVEPCRILVMASGNGSNFQALVDGIAGGRIMNARITRLIVNRAKAYATQRAEKAGIPWEYFNLVTHGFQAKGDKDAARLHAGRAQYDAALAAKVLASEGGRPELVVLAGWMHVFSKAFLDPLDAAGIRVINLHPALPGAFSLSGVSSGTRSPTNNYPGKYDGTNAIQRAFDDFQAGRLENNTTGIMVHFVIDAVDRGEPIMTRDIQCRVGEDIHALEARIHVEEHALIVVATQKVVQDVIAARSAPVA